MPTKDPNQRESAAFAALRKYRDENPPLSAEEIRAAIREQDALIDQALYDEIRKRLEEGVRGGKASPSPGVHP